MKYGVRIELGPGGQRVTHGSFERVGLGSRRRWSSTGRSRVSWLTAPGTLTLKMRRCRELFQALRNLTSGGLFMSRRDPVCHMDMDEKSAVATSRYKGDTYYFCSEQCKVRFEEDPERYVSLDESSAT
jgi:YHS domain-containing protein